MADSDPYSRLYWRLVDDPKFAAIYGDDHHFATWARLLMIADQAWPASAHIPYTTRRASIAALTGCGLLELLPGGRYKVHGLDREREKRSRHASNAAAMRWQPSGNAASIPPGNAASNAPTMPSIEEKRKEEKRQGARDRKTAPEDLASILRRVNEGRNHAI